MNVYLEIKNVTLDIPIFDASKSFRKSLMRYCVGGKIKEGGINGQNAVSVRALDNISFRLESGDRLGVIGHNGSGKTTLLRLISGVYKPFIGSVEHSGKITVLFNALAGLDGDDTGINNIYTIAMYLGMSKKEIESRKEDIINFSELGDFINLPVRTYSSGMLLRLSFSIVTSLEPQILLMDEGIGVGDMQFTNAAQARLDSFYKKLDILVVASHSDDLIKRLCNKVLLLEHGKIKAFGNVKEVIEVYHNTEHINI